MVKFLFICAVACVLLGLGYTKAYTDRKKIEFDKKCNDYFVYASALLFFGKTLCLIVLGMVVFKLG